MGKDSHGTGEPCDRLAIVGRAFTVLEFCRSKKAESISISFPI
jgi:hypothetical protein